MIKSQPVKRVSDAYKALGVKFKLPIEVQNSDGKVTYREEADGFWTRMEFDSAGAETYWEDSKGNWGKREARYDEYTGRKTVYRSSSKGYWVKSEYDKRGNQTFWETSDGEKSVAEFDIKGNETYYADTNGVVRGVKSKPEPRYNNSMTNIKPTVATVRVVLNSFGLELYEGGLFYNDKRVNGGRIKLSGNAFANDDLDNIKNRMDLLFPGLYFDVYNHIPVIRYGSNCGKPDPESKVTCIKWKKVPCYANFG